MTFWKVAGNGNDNNNIEDHKDFVNMRKPKHFKQKHLSTNTHLQQWSSITKSWIDHHYYIIIIIIKIMVGFKLQKMVMVAGSENCPVASSSLCPTWFPWRGTTSCLPKPPCTGSPAPVIERCQVMTTTIVLRMTISDDNCNTDSDINKKNGSAPTHNGYVHVPVVSKI